MFSDMYTIVDPTSSQLDSQREQEMWPLGHARRYTDQNGDNVLPTFQQPQSPLTVLDYGIELRGSEMLVKLLELESSIRGVELA